MPIGEICTKKVITTLRGETAYDAARLMAEHNVGSVVVVDMDHKPVGMVTDRDLALKVVALGKDPKSVSIKEIMSQEAIFLSQDRGIFEATRLMREEAVRRIPIVDRDGKLVGIFTMDDLWMVLGEEMAQLSGALAYTAAGREKEASLK